MKFNVEGRKVYNYIYIIVIITILFSNLFYKQLSILLMLKPNYEFNNVTEIHFVDVGQGDAIAIKFDNGKNMLIDTGIVEYRQELKYYLDNIITDNKTINYLILTHIDIDHSGNMKYILDNYNVETIYRPQILATCESVYSSNSSTVYDEIISTAISKNIQLKFNKAGESLVVGNNILTWLSPIGIDFDDNIQSNDYSPVIRLDFNNHSALFTGDISSEVEEQLWKSYSRELLDVDILKLAHHGSAYSNTSKFLEITSPDYACVCVGENTYGHPANLTIERILQYDEKYSKNLYNNLYSTKDHGNVIITLTNYIDVNFISNINNYSFGSYYFYCTILIIFLLVKMLTPYYFAYKKSRRFYLQNKKFEEDKEKQKV